MPYKGTSKKSESITPQRFKDEIGANLRSVRKATGLNQTEFGERIGVAYYQISRYERGIDDISLYMVYRICQEFDVTIDEITQGIFDKEKKAC